MRKQLVKPSTELRLLSHGLTLELYPYEDAKNPRHSAHAVFIGVDIKIPNYINKGANFEELVDNYCEKVLFCKRNDLIWRGVHKYEFDGKVEYALATADSLWDNTVIGFIYKHKVAVYQDFKINHINGMIEYRVVAQFEMELARFTKFENKEIFEVLVSGDDDAHYEVISGVNAIDDQVDAAVNKIIGNIVDIVDSTTNKVQITFEYDSFYVKDFTPYMAIITPQFKAEFDFNPMFGKPIVDEINRTITVNIDTQSLPFISYALEASKNIDLEQSMRDIAKEISDSGDYPEITDEMLDINLVKGKPNIISVNKPPIMVAIFVMALFSKLKGVKRVISEPLPA